MEGSPEQGVKPPPSLAEGLEELHALQTAPPCPATSVECNGARIPCILRQGHADMHHGGCVEWTDPHGTVDLDYYSHWRKCRRKRSNPQRVRRYLTAEGKRVRLHL